MNVAVRRTIGPFAAGIALVALTACGARDAEEAPVADDAPPPAAAAGTSEAADLAVLRQLTAGYGDLDAARAAGYTERITPCWYHPAHGAQGYHYARTELIDGQVSLHEPEILMYEPMADGSEQFIGIEYIVPFDAWEQSSPPELLGRQFMRNERLGLWVLHVWLGKDNPSGMYADWNPNVTCEHAAESEDRST
jgi:hypothetical protein